MVPSPQWGPIHCLPSTPAPFPRLQSCFWKVMGGASCASDHPLPILGAMRTEAPKTESPEAEVGGATGPESRSALAHCSGCCGLCHVLVRARLGAFLKEMHEADIMCLRGKASSRGPAVRRPPFLVPGGLESSMPFPGCSWCLKVQPLCHTLFLEQRGLLWALDGGQAWNGGAVVRRGRVRGEVWHLVLRAPPGWRSICGGLKGHTQVLGWTPSREAAGPVCPGPVAQGLANPHAEENLERPPSKPPSS